MSVTFDVGTGNTIITLPKSIADNNLILARFAGVGMGYDATKFGAGVWDFLVGRHKYYRDSFAPNPVLSTLQAILAEINAILALIAAGTLVVDPAYTPDMTQLRDDLKIEIGA